MGSYNQDEYAAANHELQDILANIEKCQSLDFESQTSTNLTQNDRAERGNYAFDVYFGENDTARSRFVTPADEQNIITLYESLSERDFKYRFHGDAAYLRQAAHDVSIAEYPGDYLQVVTRGNNGARRIIAEGGFRGDKDHHMAELMFTVAPDSRGHGIGTQLAIAGLLAAIDAGYARAYANVLKTNVNAARVFTTLAAEFSLEYTTKSGTGTTEFTLHLCPTKKPAHRGGSSPNTPRISL